MMRPALVYEQHKIDRLASDPRRGNAGGRTATPADRSIGAFDSRVRSSTRPLVFKGFVFESIPNNPRLYEQFDERGPERV